MADNGAVADKTTAAHAADAHDSLIVSGARENNLKNVSLEIPKRRLTVFTGVSGSGKSSLVFATIAAESQRMINETYSAFVQGFMPSLARPDVDALHGLTTAILVDQERMGANARSTVGTATDVGALLRILFSRIGSPHIGGPQAFSFNVASASGAGAKTVTRPDGTSVKKRAEFSVTGGMCMRCEGMGHVTDVDLSELFDDTKSLADGALTIPGYTPDGWMVRIFTESGIVPAHTPLKDLTAGQRDDFLYSEPRKVKVAGINMTYEGLIPRVQKSMLSRDIDAMQPHIRAFVERAVTFHACPDCAGTRLSEAARSVTVQGITIADASAMQVSELADWVNSLTDVTVAPVIEGLRRALQSFVDIGLGYLSLDRSASTLSGGEAQRVKMVRHLGSALTDVTYVFDEPTAGLHPHDVQRMNALLLQLRDKGNTVLVVEHKPEVMRIADRIVDMGPRAGSAGGEIVFEGTLEGLLESGTLTGEYLGYRAALKDTVRTPTGVIEVRDAVTHNLQGVDVDIPMGVLVAVTGVAGSGKSSLIHGSVAGRPGVVAIDQTPIRGSRRSSPATYTGLLEHIRKAFAKANGVKPALFSANSEGACPVCKGAGVITTELGPFSSVESPCEECEGKRFDSSVLDHLLGGLSIVEVLDLSVEEAVDFFGGGAVTLTAAHVILTRLNDVGLGYLTLGQPLSTLSGGERQRLKLATRMGERSDVYVLDEPTAGLHLADIQQLLAILDRLVDAGTSVIVIEHHQALIAHADWVVDMGPGGGHDGGTVVFQGTPAELVAAGSTLTGIHLGEYLA
jgi:excinuclease UvrABC ATPase subunit